MSLKEAIRKTRAQLGFEPREQVGTAEVTIQEQTVEHSSSLIGEEKEKWISDYLASIESDPKIQQTRRDLVQVAIAKERTRMGFPTRT